MPWGQVDRVLYDFGFPMGPLAMSRPRRARHRLGEAERSKGETISRRARRDGSPRPEDRLRWLVRLRRENLKQRSSRRAGDRADLARLHRQVGRSTPGRYRTTRSWRASIYPMVNEGAEDCEEHEARSRLLRHRCCGGERLRLAGLSRRPDVGTATRCGPAQGAGTDEGISRRQMPAMQFAPQRLLLEQLVAEGKSFSDLEKASRAAWRAGPRARSPRLCWQPVLGRAGGGDHPRRRAFSSSRDALRGRRSTRPPRGAFTSEARSRRRTSSPPGTRRYDHQCGG